MSISSLYSRCTVFVAALAIPFGVSPARGQTTPATGALSLTLVDDAGAPIGAASVAIQKVPKFYTDARHKTVPLPLGPNARAFLASDSEGRASAPTLESGDYTVCVGVPALLGIVDPCKWVGPWRVTVTAGHTATPAALVLRKGAVVRVHVTDTQHLLPKQDSITIPAFALGVRTAGNAYIGMKGSEQVTSAGRDYILTVPFDTALRLWIFSRTLRFADQSGAELLNGGNVAFNLTAAQRTRDFNLSIIGSKVVP